MAQVVYSPRALQDIERAFAFLADKDEAAAATAVTAIKEAVTLLARHPLIGRRIQADLRELVISYGETGYVALYRFVVARDELRVLALRHQRELDFPA